MTKGVLTGMAIILVALAGHALGRRSIESTSIERIMPPDEVRINLRKLDRLRAELRASAGARDQASGDIVAITISGDAPAKVRETMTATPLMGGLWKVEKIDDVAGADVRPKVRDYVLDATTSRQIGELLTRERLFDEVEGSAGLCDDHPIVSVRVFVKGRARAAVRRACPGFDPSDVTEQLIDAVQTTPR